MNEKELQRILLMPEGLRAQYLAALRKPQKMADGGAMKGFYSPINKLAAELPRTKGTGAEFMTELSKRPGYKPQEAQDRNLQELSALPKMGREEFLSQLKSKPAPALQDTVLSNAGLKPGSASNHMPKYEEHTLPGGENYREILMRLPKSQRPAKDPASGHWDQPGVLAHVRVKDRTGPNGEKLLHIEEIQSDWHQKGREQGYETPDMLQKVQEARLQHKLLKQQLEQAKTESDMATHSLNRKEPLFQQPDVQARYEAARVQANNDIMDLMPKVMKAEVAKQAAERAHNQAIPNAPFKKNWHELALKKMIHHAAEQGYHGIVITPGQEQADRYQLSKHVSGMLYDPEDTQTFQAFDKNGNRVITEHNATPERVSQLIGKELSQKLMAQPQIGGMHGLNGEDIKIGGEGIKGFYDKIVPSFLNQFGKKYGAQVGTMPIQTKAPSIEKAGTSFYQVPGKQAVLHHFPITPEMREDVTKNGVPLYEDGGAVHMSGGGSGHAFVKHKKGEKVGGYHVGEKINNYGSYESSGISKVLPGIHKVPMSSFETTHPNDLFYAKNDHDRVRHLAEQIKHNQYLDPLLVAMDEKGPYVLEGGHRLGAAHLLGMKEIPAMIGYEPEVEHLAPKAQGGSIKPVGYTKEKVTVSPNLDRMQYELMSVKHFKKAK